MEFNLKPWRIQEDESDTEKIQKLLFDSQSKQEDQKTEYSVSPQLHLFVPNNNNNNEHQQISTKMTNSGLSAYPYDHSTNRIHKEMGGGGSYFSYGQCQELELQALIYRHMLAGAAIPPQLLQMVHKSSFNISPPASNSLSSPYYVHPLQHYSQYHPALLQSGYWGRGAMDPEPGRCRRTDGKKWRCSRDVVGGQKYCERHVHRGRNRSRKSVELHTTTPSSTLGGGTTANAASAQATQAGQSQYDLLGTSSSINHLHDSQRLSRPEADNKFISEIDNMNGDLKSGGQPLRHFFDDCSNRSSDTSTSSTLLSMSTSGNVTSDFSLKLATGNTNESGEKERTQLGWGGAGWGPPNQVTPVGGPLAEVLRSSRGSNASPTSLLNLVK